MMMGDCGSMGENINGTFQFKAGEDGVYLTIYPPKPGGKVVSLKDILFYIEKRNIPGVDAVKIGEIYKNAGQQQFCGKVSDEIVRPINEFGSYYISSDCMHVEAVFFPPFEGAQELDEKEIESDIRNLGVKSGINTEVIQQFLKERKYGETYTVANGTPARNGSDGYIEYKFNVDLKPRPKMNQDGTVDFHSLENVNHVRKGDIVAVLHPEDRGEAGRDLMDRVVKPDSVKHIVFRYGKNLTVSEDGLSLITSVSGHVTLDKDKVYVSDVLEVINVDNSTGNIQYDGNVTIKGNVLAGFSVEASGDIAVSGIVEGATVKAGGNITLNRGVQGMNRAVISAGGNIVSKFIESAEMVKANGDIESDSILHSKVMAKGKIIAAGKKGLIVGGEVRSTIMVSAKNIGNNMGTATVVGVGVDPSSRKRIEELKKNLEQLGNNRIQLNQVITALRKKQESEGTLSPEKREMQQKTMRNMLLLDQDLLQYKNEYEELRLQLNEDSNARIKVSDTIYNGTKLIFGEQYIFIKEKNCHCQYAKESGDIVCLAL